MQVERVGAPDDPVEGSNVTLICSTSDVRRSAKIKIQPKWFYHDSYRYYPLQFTNERSGNTTGNQLKERERENEVSYGQPNEYNKGPNQGPNRGQ